PSIVLAVCLASLVGLAITATGEGTAQAAAVNPVLLATQSLAIIHSGSSDVIEGHLIDPVSITAFAGETVELWRAPSNTLTFTQVDEATTDVDGEVDFTESPTSGTVYELRHPASSGVAALTSR